MTRRRGSASPVSANFFEFSDRSKLLITAGDAVGIAEVLDRGEGVFQMGPHDLSGLGMIGMGSARRLWHYVIDQPHLKQIGRGQPQCPGGLLGVVLVAPEY